VDSGIQVFKTMENKNVHTFELISVIISFLLFGVLFIVTDLFKSPIIVFISFLILVIPFKHNKLVKRIIVLSSIVFVIWFFSSVLQSIIPFVIAFIIAYILNPLVEILEKKKISRAIGSLIILLGIIIIITLSLIFIIPIVISQFSDFVKSLPLALQNLQLWISSYLLPKLNSIGIPTEDIQSKIMNQLPNRLEKIINTIMGGLSGIFSGISFIFSQLVNLILLPFLSFYLLKDFDKIKGFVIKLLPKANKDTIIIQVKKVDELLGRYMRGAITVAIINAILVSIILSIIGVKYSIFLGVLAGILDLIPYFGLLISLVIGTIVALFSGSPEWQVPLTVLTFVFLNLLETSYLAPKIIGGKIGLHPALLIFSLVIFSYFFGFIGLLIALPTTSIIVMFFNEWLLKKEENN
jgi:predicted PurR-regulated permease PerM